MGRFQQQKGAGRGRGQRNTHNKFNQSNKNSTNGPTRKGVQDYVYTLGKQSMDYDVVTKFLILHIRKNYTNGDDIGNALETLQEVTFESPTLEMRSSEDDLTRKREDKENEMIFEAKLAIYLKTNGNIQDKQRQGLCIYIWTMHQSYASKSDGEKRL